MWEDINFGNPVFLNHILAGSYVLYMNRHFEFIEYPYDEAPVQPGFAFDAMVSGGS